MHALRANDGALAWRFVAAPDERLIVSRGQLESVWPVHGSVLVVDDTVYFAAGDIPTDDFITVLPTINALANRIVVTVTSDDEALAASRRIMGGGARIGEQTQQLTEEQRELILRKDQLEVVDVSRESENRGFDITGHRYWFNHPWASTDVLLAIRTDLEPEERGLEQGDSPVLWYVPVDYPQRLNDALDRLAFKRSWGEYND